MSRTLWLFADDTPIDHEYNRIKNALSDSQQLILTLLKDRGPMTDQQIYAYVRDVMSPSGARTRRSELVYRNLVYCSGRDVQSPSKHARIWSSVFPLQGEM